MEEFRVERLVYDGSDPSDDWIITGVGHSKLKMKNVQLINVDSKVDYISKCPYHENCLGHMCSTKSGVILPPQSLAIDTAVIRNDISKAADFALGGTSAFYRNHAKETLSNSMKAKTGRMRQGILNCHVDGSLRMVITPHDMNDLYTVFVPSYLKDKWRVVRLDPDTQKYVSEYVEDGDYAVGLRPPSLVKESVQYCRLSFWDKTCLGISPIFVAALRGDYDGDEIHLYPIYSEEAVAEAKEWINTPGDKFTHGISKYMSSSIPNKGINQLSYMEHTTISFKQIRDGVDPPLMAEETRTKMEHIVGLRKRFDTKMCDDNFIEESIRGMGDTNKQQLSQPIVGDMSRIARIAASCIIQQEDGVMGVVTDTGFVSCIKFRMDDAAGNPCIRGISTVCAASQQSALDSHRAKDDKLPAHDLVSDMIVGSSVTLVILNGSLNPIDVRRSLSVSWLSMVDGKIYCLCPPSSVKKVHHNNIIGSYNPIVLSYVQPDKRVDVCRFAITELVKYHSLKLTDTEVMSLAVMYSFKPDAHKSPITTRDGLTARKLHWLDVTMATHYSGLLERLRKGDIEISPAITSSSSLVTGNFRLLL